VNIATTTAGSDANPRRLDIDQLRNAAVLLLIVFHTARLFDGEDWHIKDAGRYVAADLVVRGLNLMSMPLLFLLAGASIAFSMKTRSVGAFATERVSRLLVPLLAGCVLFVLPQVWVERHAHGAAGRYSPIDFDGSLLAFAPSFFECCYPQANFSWHHLWFLAYLFSYSLALLPLLLLARRAELASALSHGAARMNTVPRLLLLGLPLLAIEWRLRPLFPSTHALAGDWANHAHFGYLVLLGWWLARSETPFSTAASAWPALMGTACALGLLWLAAPWWAAAVPAQGRGGVMVVLRVCGEWIWILALLGLAYRFLARPGWLAPFSRYALPFYVIHQALIVAMGGLWLAWVALPWLKALAVAGVAGVGTMALCRLADRYTITRWALGIKARAGHRGPPVRSAPADSLGRL
jgi:surface polysaccharide O-acyltransferase-like enzyme